MTKIPRITNHKPGQFIDRSVSQQQQLRSGFTSELENWLLEAADKPATPLTHEDFDAIRERVRSKLR